MRSSNLLELREYAPQMEERMRRLPNILDVNSDLQVRARQTSIEIDRDIASRLGLSVDQIRLLLYSAFGTRQVSTIYAQDDTYQVILEADPKYADTNEVLRRIMVRTPTGGLVPLDTVAKRTDKPTSLTVNHISQLPAVIISFNLAPGVALGEAVKSIQEVAAEVGVPATITTSFEGSAQVFQQAVANQGMLLFAAVLVIYIILGILYENFIHPLTILSGLPSAGIGALAILMLFGMDLSVIAMIGVVMLIGIVKKNAIMMVDFAVERRAQGAPAEQAIVEAALLRFRPIMMTTTCALLGSLPIAIGAGAGAELRQPLGITVVGGLLVSQLLTLFITAARATSKPASRPNRALSCLKISAPSCPVRACVSRAGLAGRLPVSPLPPRTCSTLPVCRPAAVTTTGRPADRSRRNIPGPSRPCSMPAPP
jgi:HAE1 family hydrophobic/amphiphilic exporter-1